MTKISQYPTLSNPTEDDILIGTDVNSSDETRNFSIGSIISLANETIKPYKVYTALLTQEEEDAPVATILENTLGVDIVWTRLSTGFYRATPSESIFLENKTFHFVNSNNQGLAFEVASLLNDTDDWRIQVIDDGEVVDSSLQNLPIEIRVYN
jgi:hypothetical protein